MNTHTRYGTLVAIAGALGMSGAAMGADYDESIDGDLADIASGGTMLDLDLGTNSVFGTVGGGSPEEDFAVFDVGVGQAISAITLTSVMFANGNTSTGFRLYADLGSGLEQVSSGLFDESDVGTNYLTVWDLSDVGGSIPLGPGTYGVALAEFTDGQSYSFDITVTPTPGSLAILGLGGLAATRRRR